MQTLLKIIKKNKVKLFVFTIFALAAFLRFWNLSDLLHFTLDEELEAFIVKNIIVGFHFPAIGVSVAPVGIHLSPFFYYLVAIPFWLGNLNPLAWGVTASSLGTVTTIALYLTARKMFSLRIAIFASFLYASSFLMVLYDKHFWNVTPMPLVAVVVVYSLYQLINKKKWWVIPLALALSLGISSHLSSFSLVVMTLIIWCKYKLPIFKKQNLLGIGIVFVSQFPLVVFEIRHNFYQIKALLKFFGGEHSGISLPRIIDNLMLLPKVFSRLVYTFGQHDFAREHTYGLVEIAARDTRIPLLMLLLVTFLLIFFGFLVVRSKKNHPLKLHATLILITILSLIVYGALFKGSIFEFYLNLIFPTLFIILALFLDWLWLKGNFFKILVLIMLCVLVGTNTWAVVTSFHSYGFSKKLALIAWVKEQIPPGSYELDSIGVNHKYEGYRYLFENFYQAPVKSYVDPQLAWLYQTPVATLSAKNTVVLTSTEPDYLDKIKTEEKVYSQTPRKIITKQFGEIGVSVVNIQGEK